MLTEIDTVGKIIAVTCCNLLGRYRLMVTHVAAGFGIDPEASNPGTDDP